MPSTRAVHPELATPVAGHRHSHSENVAPRTGTSAGGTKVSVKSNHHHCVTGSVSSCTLLRRKLHASNHGGLAVVCAVSTTLGSTTAIAHALEHRWLNSRPTQPASAHSTPCRRNSLIECGHHQHPSLSPGRQRQPPLSHTLPQGVPFTYMQRTWCRFIHADESGRGNVGAPGPRGTRGYVVPMGRALIRWGRALVPPARVLCPPPS